MTSRAKLTSQGSSVCTGFRMFKLIWHSLKSDITDHALVPTWEQDSPYLSGYSQCRAEREVLLRSLDKLALVCSLQGDVKSVPGPPQKY